MPWAAAKPCTTPGCTHKQPCPVHVKPKHWGRDTRPTMIQRGYPKDWHRLRVKAIKRDKVCGFCGVQLWDGQRITKGATVHHIDGDHTNNPEDGSNFMASCRECHERHHKRKK